MKRYLMSFYIIFIFINTLFPNEEKRFYFDGGLGIGNASTTIGNKDVRDFMKNKSEFCAFMGIKLGYMPIEDLPLYVSLEYCGISHQFANQRDYIYHYYHYGTTVRFNSLLLAPGVIYYPYDFLQTSLSVGFAYTLNDTDSRYKEIFNGYGYGANISVAYDFNSFSDSLLIGINYYYATHNLNEIHQSQVSSEIGVFIKYAMKFLYQIF